MPRPRFEKLSADKRERILETAAQEFATYGYAQASLNRILEAAGISKGAAYYYFDDKADVYLTAVRHYGHAVLAAIDLDVSALTATNFWTAVADLYHQQFTAFADRPWILGLLKSGGNTDALAADEQLAALMQEVGQMMAALLQRGQELGVVRADLPEELLAALISAIDDAHDRWLFSRTTALTAAELQSAAAQISDLLRRLLTP
ncbi:MAG TPA: TetR/AcrR family transcriptional regulator [Chloroflexota bacterium]|nr:TetR/AcrR family transcriptional regulator [Chloroflexota bacterium]HUM70521.1 TetR/AcrR family transcriptional regulator [Chloroflexota bacterium]